jgi:hypothetical protein
MTKSLRGIQHALDPTAQAACGLRLADPDRLQDR